MDGADQPKAVAKPPGGSNESEEWQGDAQRRSNRLKSVVIGVAVSLLVSCIILVGITLKMAPIIDELGECVTCTAHFFFVTVTPRLQASYKLFETLEDESGHADKWLW